MAEHIPKLVKGPFSLAWGSNAIVEVSELTFNYEQNTNDYETIQGSTHQVPGTLTASVELTLLATDVDTLGVFLSDYIVSAGSKLSTGETVAEGKQALDIRAASCASTETYNNLTITSCDGEVTRLPHTNVRLTGMELADNAVRTVTLTFTATPETNATDKKPNAVVQFYQSDAITEG